MTPLIKATFLILFFPIVCFSQEKDKYDKKYDWRIRQEVLYGVYIPKDVNEALIQLSRLTDAESKAKFKAMSENEAVHKLFFSLGRWMSYNWSFHDGSRLSVHLGDMGIHTPDDKSRFLIILFHRSLNKKPLEIKELLKQFHENAEKRKQEKLKSGTILFEETRKVEKPDDHKKGDQ